MKKIILTRSSCNRILKILRVLAKKDHEAQLVYLTLHMMRSCTGEERQILKHYEKGKQADKETALQLIKSKTTYATVQAFWTPARFEVLAASRERIQKYRSLTFSEQRTIDDAELTVAPPEELTVILEFLRLCY